MSYRALLKKLFNKFIKVLPSSYLEEMFYLIAPTLGVRSFVIYRKLGLFEGSVNDNMIHRYYLRNGTWANGLQCIVKGLFDNGPGTFVDVGANIGLITIPIALDNDKISFYAFEPEFDNYRFLRKNIIANDVESIIKTFNIALFSEDCSLDLELSENNKGDHRVRRQLAANSLDNYFNEESRQTVKIQARKLDNILKVKDLIKPIIMKVDTQGVEVQVFAGGKNLLEEVDYLIVEYWPYGLQRMGDTTASFLDIIKQFHWGAVFDDEVTEIPQLLPIGEFIASLVPQLDGTATCHLDLLLARQAIPQETAGCLEGKARGELKDDHKGN